MRIFAVGTKIFGGLANIWGACAPPPGPNVEPPLLAFQNAVDPRTLRDRGVISSLSCPRLLSSLLIDLFHCYACLSDSFLLNAAFDRRREKRVSGKLAGRLKTHRD